MDGNGGAFRGGVSIHDVRTVGVPVDLNCVKHGGKAPAALAKAAEAIELAEFRLESTTPNGVMNRILKKTEIRHRKFHALRHTVGTRMMELGVNQKIVAEMLGYSNVTITLNLYSHVSPTMQDDAAARMDAVLSSGS